MVGVLVRLKLTLLRAGLRSSGVRGILGAVFSLVISVVVGVLGGATFFALRFVDNGRAATDATAGAFALLLLVWVLGPIVAAGAEGTLEPDRLALFPLRPSELMPGLLLAALVGFGGLCTVLVLTGAIAGMAPASPLALVTVAAVVAELLLCASVSRCVSTAISGAVRSRRWRDVVLFVGPLVALSLNLTLQLVTRSVAPTDGSGRPHGSAALHAAGVVARLLPSGPAALAIGFARDGRLLAAFAALAGALALPVVFVALWGRVLTRVLTSASGGSGARASAGAASLVPRWLPLLPRTRVGAVAAKELRLTWRDPRQRAAVLSATFAGLVPAISFRVLSSGDAKVVLVAALPAYVLGANTTNLYGFDGQAHWANVAAGDDARSDLLGKSLARALVALPLFLVVLGGLAAKVGDVRYVAAAFGLAAAGFGTNLGLGTIASVISPLPLPDNAANVFSAGNTGRGLAAAGPSLAVLFGGLILLAPVLVPMLVVTGTARLAGLGEFGVVYGFVGWRLGLGLAVRHSQHRQPELLEALGNRHAG